MFFSIIFFILLFYLREVVWPKFAELLVFSNRLFGLERRLKLKWKNKIYNKESSVRAAAEKIIRYGTTTIIYTRVLRMST